jgi:hypothetical protein
MGGQACSDLPLRDGQTLKLEKNGDRASLKASVFRLSGVVLDAKPEDFDMANAFLLGFDPVALCTDEEAQIVPNFIAALDEEKPVRVRFVRSGFGIHAEETARAQLGTFAKGFETAK